MKTIATADFSGKKVLLRVDFNVPLNDHFEVVDDTRIRGALPTIRKLSKDGASVILMSHLGRPKGKPSAKFSLKHLVTPLSEILGRSVHFVDDCVGSQVTSKAAALQPGE